MTWKGYFELTDFENRVRLQLGNFDEERGIVTEVEPLTFQVRELDRAIATDPPVMFKGRTSEAKAMLQAIVDLAWSLGIRPTEMTNYQRQNAAQARHLEDMRALVAKAASTELPK